MTERLSSKDFLKLAEILWKGTAKVKYQRPDAWISYLVK